MLPDSNASACGVDGEMNYKDDNNSKPDQVVAPASKLADDRTSLAPQPFVQRMHCSLIANGTEQSLATIARARQTARITI